MPSTAPDLTWAMTATTTPATSTSISDLIAACNTVITASDWQIHASAADYILIGPPAGSSAPNIRILIAGDSTGPNAANMQAPHTTAADRLYVGIAPDSGKTALTNAWNSPLNPFDSDRWSGFLKCSGNTTSVATDTVHSIFSEESIALFLYNTASDEQRVFVAGAVIDPPDDVDGEGTPGRVYGVFVTGEAAASTTMHGGVSNFLGDGAAQNNAGRIFDPASTSTLIHVDKMSVTGLIPPRMRTLNDGTFFLPIISYRENGGNQMIGVFRQIGIWEDASDRTIIQDSGSVDKGFVFSTQRTGAADSVVFYNK